jgi:hypothetical protein
MRKLKTNEREDAERVIKNAILKEVRCVQSRVEARRYQQSRAFSEQDVASDQGVINDRASNARTPSEMTRSISPSRRTSPNKQLNMSMASPPKSALKNTTRYDLDKTQNSFAV